MRRLRLLARTGAAERHDGCRAAPPHRARNRGSRRARDGCRRGRPRSQAALRRTGAGQGAGARRQGHAPRRRPRGRPPARRASPAAHPGIHGSRGADVRPRDRRATSIFSVVYGVLLRPLPYARSRSPRGPLGTQHPARSIPTTSSSLDNFEAWQARATSFAGMAAVIPTSVTFTDGTAARAHHRRGGHGRVFRAARASRPRWAAISPAEDRRDTLAMMLSDGYWRRRFGGDPSVVGRVRTIAGTSLHHRGRDAGRIRSRRGSGGSGRRTCGFRCPGPSSAARGAARCIVLARLRDGVADGRAREPK